MQQRILMVRHDDGPDDDLAASFFANHGVDLDIRRPFDGDMLGDVSDDLIGTIIYGGPFSAFDTETHPFLNEEYRWIEASFQSGLPMLGICQGTQMIAHHQGAWVGERDNGLFEFGYYEVRPSPDAGDFLTAPLFVPQAHYHTFDLPEGATLLASSDAYENQAFRLGENVYGLQFHPERSRAGFRRWQTQLAEVYGRPGVQTRAMQDSLIYKHEAAQAKWFDGLLGKLFRITDGRETGLG